MTAAAAAPVWIDGALVEARAARVSPFDHGFVVGDGAFETMKVVEGQAFALSRHLRRLRRSLDGLGIDMPDEPWLRSGVESVLGADPAAGRLRITVSSGPGELGSSRVAGAGTVVVATGPRTEWAPASVAALCPWRRNEHSAVAGLKTTSYAENARALAWAHERGADEALFLNTAGRLCEGTGTNVYVNLDGALATPPLSSGCLAGITRELLLELGAVVEADLSVADLEGAVEICLTSSTRDVHPVAQLDGRALSAPGPLTKAAAEAFAELQMRTLDP